MSLPKIADRDEWLQAREDLLAKEKSFTEQRDALNTERRNLPMVKIDEVYKFEGPSGTVDLPDLFEGRPQLIIYHFMFHPEWEDGCPSCTAGIDEVSPGFLEHLHTRDTTFALVSRAPLEKLERWKASRGWEVPWYSSGDTDFNYDFGVTIDASRGFDTYNYRTLDEYAAMGHESMKTSAQPYDMPGRSCFLRVDGDVFHTYSQYARGLESTGGSYYFLDLTALGRQEEWEEPKGRTGSARGANPDFRVVSARPVVHFEIVGKDPDALRRYYGELFDWEFATPSPVATEVSAPDQYGFLDLVADDDGTGIRGGVGGGEGYGNHAVFYVAVPDVEAALLRAEALGGARVMGPATSPNGLVVGHFTDPEGTLIGVAGVA